MNKHLYRAAFGVGLLAIGWVAAGYLRTNPLALVMTLLIAAFYGMGALELRRFGQATAGLAQALADIPQPLPELGGWLARVPASLQNVVRLRIEGDRVALPGPAMTPYLAGLLVLLGMLGTFLGMVVTLNGTGLALERATDLQTMRESLAAPVRGLGLAFGTSVAGVAASAMLGLMSALCRRERLQAAQTLEACLAGALRRFGRTHQREQAWQLQQQQAALMPALVDQLQAVVAQLAAQARQSDERLLASQERFHGQAEAAYRALALSVDGSLQQSLTDSARIAAATIQPVVEATMAGITRETAALHGRIAGTVQQQLDGLATQFEAATRTVTGSWTAALAAHEDTSERLAGRLDASLAGLGDSFAQRSAALLEQVAGSHASLVDSLGSRHAALVDTVTARHVALADGMTRSQQALVDRLASRQQALVDQLTSRQQALSEGIAGRLAAGDAQRLAAWTDGLAAMAEGLRREWQQAGAASLAQQAQICATLEQTAGRIAAQAEAQARGTIAEVAGLVQAASEAPRAAAELVAQLREKLSDSLAHDTAMLAERSRVMATLNSLLDAVQHTATEQKAAIDQLVASTADWLAQAGGRFTERIDAESARMTSLAAQLTGSAVEVASLGEAFGVGVQQFSQSSGQLMAHLQRVDETLARSITRSDEQLAYYVAQARELIDLSLLSQKQIVDELQRVAGGRAAPAAEA